MSTTPTDTPLTDAEEFDADNWNWVVDANFARALERSIAELNQRLVDRTQAFMAKLQQAQADAAVSLSTWMDVDRLLAYIGVECAGTDKQHISDQTLKMHGRLRDLTKRGAGTALLERMRKMEEVLRKLPSLADYNPSVEHDGMLNRLFNEDLKAVVTEAKDALAEPKDGGPA